MLSNHVQNIRIRDRLKKIFFKNCKITAITPETKWYTLFLIS